MREKIGALFAAAIIAGMVAVSPALAQPPVDEVARALKEIVDLVGIWLPFEAALLYGLAVIITYLWAAIGLFLLIAIFFLYITGSFLITLSIILGVLGTGMEIIGEALSQLLLTGFLWEVLVLMGAIIVVLVYPLGIIGKFMMDLSNALKPLEEYFPPPWGMAINRNSSKKPVGGRPVKSVIPLRIARL
jgi:hypothetical protein